MTMRWKPVLAVLLVAASAARAGSGRIEWIGETGQRVKAELFPGADAGATPVLVIVLHGDAPRANPTYQYDFAAKAAMQLHGIIAAALLRPGYTDGDGDTSDGKRGDATGDNYTPEVLDRLDAAVRRLKVELHPSLVILLGHSGGAALSADLIARDPALADAALLLSCPCDVPAWRQHMKTLYPSPLWDQPVPSVSPIDVVDKISPKARIWMMVGEKDDVAPTDFTQRYAAVLQKHGIHADVTVLPGRDHEILLDDAVIPVLSKVIAALQRN
jgi:pimeloyl-ACP methyl ester carboxylesterase